MDKIKNCVAPYLPGLPKSDVIQLSIFVTLFSLASSVLLGNWLGISFLFNNGAILLMCFFTIALPPNARIYYLFSTALPISAFIDIMSIIFNWDLHFNTYPGFLFFFSFFMTIFLVIVKLIFGIHQFEIAKTLNSEKSPISIRALYKSFIDAITLQQTPIENKQLGVDVEAPGPTSVEIEVPVQPKDQQQSTTNELASDNSIQAQESVSSEKPSNFNAFQQVNEEK